MIPASDAPLFRLPFTDGISVENNFSHPQEGELAEGESEEEGEVEHRNELALILAGTYESSEEENYFTIGAEYEYLFHPRVGISGTIEYISGPDAWILVFPVVFHPKGGLKILAGPGVELKPRRGSDENGESNDDETEGDEDSGTDKLFLFRLGVAYSFEFGERYSITPALEFDFVNEEDEVAKALVYGVTFGISF
jgi:hypothetical protein